MSSTAQDIDNNMYQLYVGDAGIHTQTLAGILDSAADSELTDAMLNAATKAVQSISSGAKLCNIPRIPQVTDGIAATLLLLSNNKIHADTQTYTTLSNAIAILDDLNKTAADDVTQWFEDNDGDITQILAELTSLANKQHSEPATSSVIEPDSTNQKQAQPARKSSNIDTTMLDLFKVEAEEQARNINENLLALENDPGNNSLLEPLMRASHSIKGAARMIGFEEIVAISHRMEDCFVHSQKGKINLDNAAIDLLLYCNDFLETIAMMPNEQLSAWLETNQEAFDSSLTMLEALANGQEVDISALASLQKTDNSISDTNSDDIIGDSIAKPARPADNTTQQDSSVRIQSERLNRMLAVSNELLVSQHWIQGHHGSLQLLKKRQTELATSMAKLRQGLEELDLPEEIYTTLLETENRIDICRQSLHQNISQVDEYDRKSYVLSSRLNQEVIASRMRPFADGTHGFKRMVRDVSQSLGKEVTLELDGLDTLVDSDILDKIEAPLTHLLRNAIDHGIETTNTRTQKGKSPQGLITVSAYHNAGRLNITIKDDGKGVDLEKLKHKIIGKGMVNQQMADKLSESELLEFLFLPGFSTRDNVTEFSGRGVGLDVVHSVITSMRGQIRSSSKPDQGLKVQLQLPLTLSVLHSLLTDIGGEYYAFPLTRIHAIIKTHTDAIFTLENKQLIKYADQDVSLINGRQILECAQSELTNNELMEIVILSERSEYYAIVVDKIVAEANLALHPIDPRLGKIKDISAAAIADDGRPVLVIDIDDLLINIQELIGINKLGIVERNSNKKSSKNLKKILVIDDSLTVREVERNLLDSRGYDVKVAIDGVDGWNTVKQQAFDLIITDIDMPRMNGIELVTMLKNDARLNTIPVMIVSYKDNPEDRQKGLEAGADYYLTKGSFHDEGLITGVIDLIGEPTE